MKKFFVFLLLSLSLLAQAKIFKPISGMELKCFDEVSNQSYLIKLIDWGDQDAEITVKTNGQIIDQYGEDETHFSDSSQDASFIISRSGQYLFSIVFENYNTKKAYYMDNGDSRSLDCRLIK